MTLREQCEAFCLKYHRGAVVRDDDNQTTFTLTLADIQRFARSQQAVGLREAAEMFGKGFAGLAGAHRWMPFKTHLEEIEQRAREREA